MTNVAIKRNTKCLCQQLWNSTTVHIATLIVKNKDRLTHRIIQCFVLTELFSLLYDPIDIGLSVIFQTIDNRIDGLVTLFIQSFVFFNSNTQGFLCWKPVVFVHVVFDIQKE